MAGGLAGLLLSLTGSGVAGLTFATAGLALALGTQVISRRRRDTEPSPAAAQAGQATG